MLYKRNMILNKIRALIIPGLKPRRDTDLVGRGVGELATAMRCSLPLNSISRNISNDEGLVEVVADKQYWEALGMHFIGQGAGEMAAQTVPAIHFSPSDTQRISSRGCKRVPWQIYLSSLSSE
jgi:hypothetical protein